MIDPLSDAHQTGTGALLIDLDGTLIDSSPAHQLAFEQALSAVGMEPVVDYQRIAGMSSPDAALSLGVTGPVIAKFVSLKRANYLAAVTNSEVHEFLGAAELVTVAAELGWKLALVTSASRTSVASLTAQLSFLRQFAVVVSADDVARNKPAPDGYVEAMSELAVTPQMCVGIEDSDAGIAALTAAGVKSVRVGVGGDATKQTELEALTAELRSLGTTGADSD